MVPPFILALSYLAVLAAAFPTQSPLGPFHHTHFEKQSSLGSRACAIELPISYQQISEDAPSTSFPQSRLFNVSQAQGGTSNIDTLVRFAGIPSGSFGCQLEVSFTFDYPISNTGNTLLSVYSLPNDISKSDTYKTYFPNEGRGTPKDSFLFASIKVTGQKAVLNSQSCKPALGYLFQIASDTAEGAVSFVDAGNNLSGIGGFFLTHNC